MKILAQKREKWRDIVKRLGNITTKTRTTRSEIEEYWNSEKMQKGRRKADIRITYIYTRMD